MLAVWLGLRQSEILGLEWRDIDGDTLKIRRAIVLGEDGPTQKGTKTYSGTRPLHIPAYIRELLDRQPRSGDRIVNMTGKSIYSGFSRICEKSGVPHFRFHDLRHVNASAMLAVGVPDKYSMKRMGQAHGTRHKQYAENDVSTHHQRERSGVRPENRELY